MPETQSTARISDEELAEIEHPSPNGRREEEDFNRRAFYQKLKEVQQAVRTLQADTTRHGAESVKPDSTIEQIKPHLLTAGLVLEYDLEELRQDRYLLEKRKSGTAYEEMWHQSTAIVRFHLTDAETGYTVTRRASGSSLNKDGDGVVHSQSQAMKQFLLKTMMATVGQEADLGNRGPDRSQWIEEARELRFQRLDSGDYIRLDTGDVLRLCPDPRNVHGPDWPMIQANPQGTRWLCIREDCGHTEGEKTAEEVEHEQQQEEEKEVRAHDEARTTYEKMAEKFEPWQVDAVAYCLPDVLEKRESWGRKDFEAMCKVLRNPSRVRKCVQKMADDIPADPGLKEILQKKAGEADIGAVERARIQDALQSGYNDALVYWLEELDIDWRELEENGA